MSGTVNSSISASTPAPASASASASAGAVTQSGTTALSKLSGNFSDFLTMLMTQLKNQDPSSPMDASQFTSELVQFSSVEQQINTNGNLTQLIQLTQASQVEQSAALIGKPVTANSTQLSLQKGNAEMNFNTTSAEPVSITIFNSAGAAVRSASLTSAAGANSWNWDGKAANGLSMPDGAYKVSMTAVGDNSSSAQIPFTITGTATSVQNNSGTVQVQIGGLTLPFSAVQSVGN